MQRNTAQSTRNSVSQPTEDLLKQTASRFGLLAGLIIVICTAVIVVHWPTLSTRAMWLDDHEYLTENLLVQNPGWSSARRFLTEVLEPSSVGGYYQPLTMLSLMIDYVLGGRADNLLVFHRTSLVLHSANTALVIVLFYLLFGRAPVAAGVGLLFGVHPVMVESICWVSERKTLLAAFFALWCLILYVRFARSGSRKNYVGCVAMYVLALMSKPTSLPLPVLMLLVDFWPLKRLNRRAVTEKLPFFVIGVVSAVITYISQSRTAITVMPGEYGPERIPLILCHNIIFYLYKSVWPVNLSSFYVFPKPLGLSDPMILAGVIGTCILIPLLVISLRWTRALLTGWLFFFVAIFPTMGVIGFTNVIAANRFIYLPSVGLLMVLMWLLGWLYGNGSVGRLTMRHVVTIIIVLMLAGGEAAASRRYIVHWRDTVSYCRYMLTLTPDAWAVHNNLGIVLESQGKVDEAISHYREALRSEPGYANSHDNLGGALAIQGKIDEAISHYRQAIKIEPNFALAWYHLGLVLESQGKIDEAIDHFHKVVEIKPTFPDAHNELGVLAASQGKFNEAVSHYRKALQLNPNYVEALNNFGTILAVQGKLDEAIIQFRRALRVSPGLVEARNNLGKVLMLQGKFNEAADHYHRALELALAGRNEQMVDYLRKQLELCEQAKSSQGPAQQQDVANP